MRAFHLLKIWTALPGTSKPDEGWHPAFTQDLAATGAYHEITREGLLVRLPAGDRDEGSAEGAPAAVPYTGDLRFDAGVPGGSGGTFAAWLDEGRVLWAERLDYARFEGRARLYYREGRSIPMTDDEYRERRRADHEEALTEDHAVSALFPRAASDGGGVGVETRSITQEEGRDKMRAWARTSAQNASKLSDAAIFALEYELAEEGLAKTGRSEGEVLNDLRALQRLKAALNPPASSGERPVEEEPPPKWRAEHPNGRTFRMGDFAIFADRQPAGPWHVTVSHPKRLPALEELAVAASAVGEGLNFCAVVRSGASVEPSAGGFVVHLYQANTSAGGG